MAKYKVIIPHDGLQAGQIIDQPVSPITEYMTVNGFWELQPEDAQRKGTKKPRNSKSKGSKK